MAALESVDSIDEQNVHTDVTLLHVRYYHVNGFSDMTAFSTSGLHRKWVQTKDEGSFMFILSHSNT